MDQSIPAVLEHCLHPIGSVYGTIGARTTPPLAGYDEQQEGDVSSVRQWHRCCFCGGSTVLVGKLVSPKEHGPHDPRASHCFTSLTGIRCPARPY